LSASGFELFVIAKGRRQRAEGRRERLTKSGFELFVIAKGRR